MKLNKHTKELISLSLTEDIGNGDVTTNLLVSNKLKGIAKIICKEDGIICGVELAKYICKLYDKRIRIKTFVKDGDAIKPKQTIMELNGSYSSLLTIERTLLNFMQRMSGIASTTNVITKNLTGTKTTLLDTRKTVPGHRMLDKYAVKTGGGMNHRIGLYDMILIKENHITAAGSITNAFAKLKKKKPAKMLVEVETTNLDEVKEALNCGADIIMLDNMNLATMRKAVKLIDGKCKVEASGGISLRNAKAIAKTGVDYISIGNMTHSVKALDIAMYIELIN